MEGWVIALVAILAVLMACIAALVGYLLYRPKDSKKKKKMKPDGKIATKYPDPPENGDVKLNMPEEGNGTMLPPYSSKESLTDDPKEIKVEVESPDSHSDTDKDSTPEDNPLLKEVKVDPQERPVDVGDLQKKEPCSEGEDAVQPPRKASSKGSSSPSSSSSSSGVDSPEIPKRPDDLNKDVSSDNASLKKPTPKKRSASPVSSSSSTSEDEDDTPLPMPLMRPHIVSKDISPKQPDDDVVLTAAPEADSDSKDDLVSNVLAAVKKKEEDQASPSDDDDKKTEKDLLVPEKRDSKKTSSSSSSSDKEDIVVPKVVVEEEIVPKRKDRRSTDGEFPLVRERQLKDSPAAVSSSDEDFDPAAERRKQPPKPIKRKKRPSLEKEIPHDISSSSTSSESDAEKPKERGEEISTQTAAFPPVAKVAKQKPHKETPPIVSTPISTQTAEPRVRQAWQSSSSSSSESAEEAAKFIGPDISTQTVGAPVKKKSKSKKIQTITPRETSPVSTQTMILPSSSASSSSESDVDIDRREVTLYATSYKPDKPKQGFPISTQTEKSPSTSTTSSSTSEAEVEFSVSPKGEISTQTTDISTPRKKSKKRRAARPYEDEYKTTSPDIDRKSSLRSASIPSSESEREVYRMNVQGTPRVGPRPWSPTHGRYDAPNSPQFERSTQTLVAPSKKPKRTKSKEPVKPPPPIIITMTDKCIQTMKTSSTSSSSSEVDETAVEPKVIHVYEKAIQMSSSSSDSEEEREKLRIRTQRDVVVEAVQSRVMVSAGTGTEGLKRKSKKIVASSARHEHQHGFETISLDLGPEEQFKTETVMELPPGPKKVVFTTAWGKQADLIDLHDAGVIDSSMKAKLEAGELDPSDEGVWKIITPFISCNRPVAGILLVESGEKISIYEATNRGLIRRGTAISLLEAEVATGGLIDPRTGHRMSVEQACQDGFIDKTYEAVLDRAERAVHGYKPRGSDRVLSIFEAMNRGLIVYSHGIRLLEAQLATGGIIDPRANHRVPLEVAYRRKLFDRDTMKTLEDPNDDTKGFYDPNTERSLTYLEIISKCVTDQDTGVLLFPLEPERRGRSPTTSTASVRSSTSVEMKSPTRSRSEERVEVFTVAKSSSDSDGSKRSKRKQKEIKSSSARIELVKTPVLSGDDDDLSLQKSYRSEKTTEVMSEGEEVHLVEAVMLKLEKMVEMPDEPHKKREISKTSIALAEPPTKYGEVHLTVKSTDEKEKSSSSSISSSSIDEVIEEKKIATVERKDEEKEESSSSEITTTTTVITTTEIVTEKRPRSRHDIKFKSGWNRKASLLDLFAAGVVTQQTVSELEEGIIKEEDVEKHLQQYLVGEEPIAGILISETGEKMSIYSAWRKGLIRRGTSISLLEAQAATGRILDPKTGDRLSVEEASKKGLIDRGFEAVLARAERAVYGYSTRLSSDILSLFQAMKRGLVVENHGIRLLEAQIATGGIIDPNANHRLPVEVAYERGLFDKRINEILEDPSDDTRGFFDPNTEENLTYLELMERCVNDKDTGMRLLPLRMHRSSGASRKSKVVFESRTGRQVTLQNLLNADRIDSKTAKRFENGEMSKEEINMMVAKLRVFVDGTMPIAGVINTDTGDRMSIYEAAKCGLIRRGTAFELLEAQACCGKLIDVQSGRVITIETAIRSGVIDREFKDVVERAHRAVTGYREPFKRELLSLCEAINRHLIVRRHGIRLLEAQIATGGIVDILSPVRIDVDVALKRALIDSKLAEELGQKLTQSYFDPVTGENLNYSEIMGRCVTDKDSGLLYLMVEGGTVTGYVRPFEPEHASRIRSTSASPGKITSEEVVTTYSASSEYSTEMATTRYKSESTTAKKRKKKSKSSSSKKSTSSLSSESSEAVSPSIISRKVIIVDPDTNEEVDVLEALRRNLIDKETADQLTAQQGDFEETS